MRIYLVADRNENAQNFLVYFIDNTKVSFSVKELNLIDIKAGLWRLCPYAKMF